MRVAAELGLDTLVEAHDAAELDRGIALGARVLGVNARDLSTFAIDRKAQLELVARIPADRIVIAESGIATRAQGAAAELAGADAVLVGSTLMRAPDPAAKLAELLSRPLVKVCGLTRDEDVAAAAEAGADMAGFVLVPESPRAARGARRAGGDALGGRVGRRAGAAGADLDQVHTVEEGKVRGREARLSGRAGRWHGCSTFPGREPTPPLDGPLRPKAVSSWRAGSDRTTCGRRSRQCGRGPSTLLPRSSRARESRITTR